MRRILVLIAVGAALLGGWWWLDPRASGLWLQTRSTDVAGVPRDERHSERKTSMRPSLSKSAVGPPAKYRGSESERIASIGAKTGPPAFPVCAKTSGVGPAARFMAF